MRIDGLSRQVLAPILAGTSPSTNIACRQLWQQVWCKNYPANEFLAFPTGQLMQAA